MSLKVQLKTETEWQKACFLAYHNSSNGKYQSKSNQQSQVMYCAYLSYSFLHNFHCDILAPAVTTKLVTAR